MASKEAAGIPSTPSRQPDGSRPRLTATNGWAVEAYDAVMFPCANCWHLGRGPAFRRVKSAEFCPTCRSRRRSFLRTRQQYDARNNAPYPSLHVSAKDTAALADAYRSLDAACLRLDASPDGIEPKAVSGLYNAGREILDLLAKSGLNRVLSIRELERRGLLPPFRRRQRGSESTTT